MATREGLQRALRATETLGSVVQTMKALASVRIVQVRRAVVALDASVANLELAFMGLLRHQPELARARPLPEGAPWALVVFGSDHGLCGPFNERIAVHAERLVARTTVPLFILALGRRLRPRLLRRGLLVGEGMGLPASPGVLDVAVMRLLDRLMAWRADGVERVWVLHQRPQGGARYTAHGVQLLPLDAVWLRSLQARPWPTRALPLLESGASVTLSALVRQHLTLTLARAFAASQAAENGARLAAMEAAERNVAERLQGLQHAAHLQRQNAVTAELLDVQAAYLAGEAG
jgi:F-type H+-transporting ATPase subunit gamma